MLSTFPPTSPAIEPYATPTIIAMNAQTRPITIETLPPTQTRVNISRPAVSVPNQYVPFGEIFSACAFCSLKENLLKCGPAITMNTRRIMIPIDSIAALFIFNLRQTSSQKVIIGLAIFSASISSLGILLNISGVILRFVSFISFSIWSSYSANLILGSRNPYTISTISCDKTNKNPNKTVVEMMNG